jgi:peptide/nickel transport system substrate-binding protein
MAIALVTLAVVAAACGSSSSGGSSASTAADAAAVVDDGTPVDGGSMVIAVGNETNGWNPASNQIADNGTLVISSVLEPLATIGPDLSAVPWLADSWQPNADFTSWVLKLHPGISFHDGTPFDAQAVVDNVDAYTNGAITGLLLQPMVDHASVVDPLTVRIDLKQPWAAFPNSFLVNSTAYMMAPSMIAAGGDGSAHPVGTGPFVFDSWQSGGSFKVSKNPSYWKAGLPHLDSLEFKVIPDDSARVAALQSGDVNMILTTTAAPANDLAGSYTVVKDWTTANVFLVTNTSPELDGQSNPLSNIHARKALAYATDRQAVAGVVGEGVSVPTSPWAPSNPWGMPDDQNGYVDFDLDQAKSEVAAYEADTGESKLTFTVSGLPDVDGTRVLQLIQSQWAEAGIDTKIETREQAAYIGQIAVGKFQVAYMRNYGYSDPDMNYHFWSSSTANGPGTISVNFSQYWTPQIDADLTIGRGSPVPDVRKKAYNDLAVQLNAGFTNIWLYRTPYSLIAERQVRGLNGPRQIPFGAAQPKTWLADLWRAPAGS